ncbi:MAG TPA: heavy metal translocating P-type ATPase [Oscillospiraceae bacterium]|nr:heavy metal translocating P-type ATPase [Oscillospiraceae bacterium]
MKCIKKQFVLEGLCCGNCAVNIEEDVKRLEGISFAAVDFVNKILTIETADVSKLEKLTKQAERIVKQHDSNIIMIEKGSKKTSENQKNENIKKWVNRIRLAIGTLLFILGFTLSKGETIRFIAFFASYVLIGGEIVLRAVQNMIKGKVFDENFLMSVATIGAFAIGEYPEGVAVMLFYKVGESLQKLAVNRSRKSISALMNIKPEYANLKKGSEIVKVLPEEVNTGDLIIIKPGEKVPLDGVVVEGFSALDTSALTGETMPLDVSANSQVLSASINLSGLLTVKVTKVFGESAVSKILELVENASSKKAPTENFITKFAKVYTPIAVLVAIAVAFVPPLIMPSAMFSVWIYRALAFLVVSCPCALVISIPLGFFGGIGGASKNGILVKGGNFLEALSSIDTVVFDKTGTLTKGEFSVTEIAASSGWTESELLSIAAHAESFSNHPIAISIQKSYKNDIDKIKVSQQEEIAGQGVRAVIDGKEVLAGNEKLMDSESIKWQKANAVGSVIYVAVGGVFAGYIVVSDTLKKDSKKAIKKLKSLGIKQIIMLTGDNEKVGVSTANELGIDKVYTQLLPNEKVEKFEEIKNNKKTKGKVVFVGDGINDAPVLASADIGFAMGALGSDAAIEAADIVLMTDEPSKIADAIKIAKRTQRIIRQNIIFAISIKVITLILTGAGIATMWQAVFGDVGVTVLAVMNSMRAMKKTK